jgi:hypothetical protein
MGIGSDMYFLHMAEEEAKSGRWRESRKGARTLAEELINSDCCDFPTGDLVRMVKRNRTCGKRLLRFCRITTVFPWVIVRRFAPGNS